MFSVTQTGSLDFCHGLLGARTGAVLEVVDPRGAPLRLWVAAIEKSDGDHSFISPATAQMLALAPGALVEVRVLLAPPA
jgi:hypothetical protein